MTILPSDLRRLAVAFTAVVTLACASRPAETAARPAAAAAAPVAFRETTIIIVRHAEKAPEPADDPALSDVGTHRANDLADALGSAGIDAILVSELQRTALTARPIAERLGITPVVVPVRSGAGAQAQAIASAIRSSHAGETVLVVGHSNTVPLIARALGVTTEFAIPDAEYDNLIVVRLRDGRTTWLRARFGA